MPRQFPYGHRMRNTQPMIRVSATGIFRPAAPAQDRSKGGGGGQAGELFALGRGEAHALPEEVARVVPVEILGLRDMDGS